MNKYFIAGGLAAVVLAAKLAYQNFFNKHQPLSKQLVILKLINMRQYLYPILFEISQIVTTKLSPKGIPPDQAKMFIMQSQQLAFKQNISTILKQKVYNDIDQETLQYAIEHTYKHDKQVQFYKKSFQQQYDKCFLGIKPQNLSTKMIIINKSTLLKITSSLLENKLHKLKHIVRQCKQQSHKFTGQQYKTGEQKQKSFNQKIYIELNKDQKEDDQFRQQLLQKYQINDTKNFQFAVAKFLQQSNQFKNKFDQLQNQFKKNAQRLLDHAQENL